MPVDMNAPGGDDDAGGLLSREEMDGLESSGEGKERAAADEEAELAGGVGIDDGEHDHRRPEDGHARGDGDGGPLAAREAGGESHLKETLGGGIDAELGVVDQIDLSALTPGAGQTRKPVLLRGADGIEGGDGLGRRGHALSV